MPPYTSNRDSYFRIVREVEPAQPTEDFLLLIGAAAARAFASERTVLEIEPADNALYEGRSLPEVNLSGLPVPEVKVYSSDKLRYTHFEYRTTDPTKRGVLSRLNNKIEETITKVGGSEWEVPVKISGLTVTRQPGYQFAGDVLALAIKADDSHTILDAQNKLFYELVQGAGAGSELDGAYVERPLIIPIAELPKRRSGSYDAQVAELLKRAALYLPILPELVLCQAMPNRKPRP